MMNVKVSRNDLCPCGSGKKYKKCCGAHEAVSITQMVENEIADLQKQILHYAFEHFMDELSADFEDLESVFFIDERETDFYQFVHAIWFTLFWEIQDDERIIDNFIESESRKIKRPKLREILQSWTKAKPIAGKFLNISGNIITVEDGLTREKMEVVLTDPDKTFEIGTFFVGMLLPYDQKYVFFPAPFDLPNLDPEQAFAYILDKSNGREYDTPAEYLIECFLEIMNELPRLEHNINPSDFEWPAPIYQEVAQLFENRLEAQGTSKPIIDTGIILWHQFCQIKQKRIQNPTVYVAAIHYLLSCVVPLEKEYTQKGTAEMYGVSVGTMSSIFREIFDALEPDIRKMQAIIQEEIYAAPAPASNKVNFKELEKKQKAQELIYEAYEAEGDERYELAEKATKLHPHCVDAYLILAERARSKEEALVYYERAKLGGEIDLGPRYFEENKGYFWGLSETRPYMRAKFQFAETLYLLGRVTEAVEQYEEMMNLNPNDNQGVRYSLFAAYMDLGKFSKAHRLLLQYKEGTTHHYFNLLLLELLENGVTLKAHKLLKDAKKENKYVIDYLTGKKPLPTSAPDYYGFGDENEAIVYADIHLHLWEKVDGVREWLKK